MLNYPVIFSHRRGTRVSSETYSLSPTICTKLITEAAQLGDRFYGND